MALTPTSVPRCGGSKQREFDVNDKEKLLVFSDTANSRRVRTIHWSMLSWFSISVFNVCFVNPIDVLFELGLLRWPPADNHSSSFSRKCDGDEYQFRRRRMSGSGSFRRRSHLCDGAISPPQHATPHTSIATSGFFHSCSRTMLPPRETRQAWVAASDTKLRCRTSEETVSRNSELRQQNQREMRTSVTELSLQGPREMES